MIKVFSQLVLPNTQSENSGKPQIRYQTTSSGIKTFTRWYNLALDEDVRASAHTVELALDSSTYELTAKLKDADGNLISTSNVIDLPIESMVVNVTYSNGVLTITLQNGQTIQVDISDIVSGLVNDVLVNGVSVVNANDEAIITIPTALSDLSDDSTHRLVTDTEKAAWDDKVDKTSAQTISGDKTFTGVVDTSGGTLKVKAIQALTGSSTTATTYGLGTSGQVLKSNGSNVYWATDTSNNNAYYLQSYYFTPNAGAEAIYRYKLVALDKDNRAVPITITDQSNTTMVEKTPTSVAFKPWKIFQYNTTATVAAGGALASHTLQETYNANPVYNFNTTISAKRLVYLCGTFDRTTGLFTLDTTMNASNQYRSYYVQVPTNTANITLSSYFTSGKDYILVGGNYGSNTTNLQLFVCNPMYHFDGTNLLPYDTYNASRIESAIPTVNNGTLTIQLNGSNVQTFTANQSTAATANIQALPNFSLNISHQTAGNPRQVKFLTIDYNTKATYFKMSATSCHDNGTSYQFLEDIIIGCTTGGSVVCNVYKYCQASVTLDSVTRNYGDVFYVIDTTNKLVDFYILCGQYAMSQFTPATKIGNTTIQYITQYTGTAVYYSTGTKVWANGNSTTYATLADIENCAVTNDDNNFSEKQTFTAGVKISGRYVGSGDDEGLIIAPATNNYAGVCCGTPSGRRAVFYLKPSAASANSVWRYNNGSTTYDIAHPEKSGTIALTSDIPAAKYMHTVRISIPSSGGESGNLYFSYISNTSTAITTMTDLMTDIPTGRGYIFGVGGEKQSSAPAFTHVINYCYKKSDTTFGYDAVLFSSSYPYGTWITDSTILASMMSLSSDTVVSI